MNNHQSQKINTVWSGYRIDQFNSHSELMSAGKLVLVTGGTGFIGRHVIKSLIESVWAHPQSQGWDPGFFSSRGCPQSSEGRCTESSLSCIRQQNWDCNRWKYWGARSIWRFYSRSRYCHSYGITTSRVSRYRQWDRISNPCSRWNHQYARIGTQRIYRQKGCYDQQFRRRCR